MKDQASKLLFLGSTSDSSRRPIAKKPGLRTRVLEHPQNFDGILYHSRKSPRQLNSAFFEAEPALRQLRSPIKFCCRFVASSDSHYGFPFLPGDPELCAAGIASGQTKPFCRKSTKEVPL